MKLIATKSIDADFYIDTMIVQTLVSNTSLYKTADMGGIGSALIEQVKHYVDNNIDPNNRAASLLGMLSPALLYKALNAMGFKKISILLSVAASFFRIDIINILSSIWDGLHGKLKDGKPMKSSEIEDIVTSSVQANAPADLTSESYVKEYGIKNNNLCDARIAKLAIINTISYNKINKKAATTYGKEKSSITNVLTRILSWIFKIAVGSSLLLVTGDVISSVLGLPNAFNDTVQKGKRVSAPIKTSTQTKFKIQSNYSDNPRTAGSWIVNIPNNSSSIENMLVLFAKKVYQGLDGLESKIVNIPTFQLLRNNIAFYNKSSAGDNMVFMPSYLTTEKQAVDYFIDDVAKQEP